MRDIVLILIVVLSCFIIPIATARKSDELCKQDKPLFDFWKHQRMPEELKEAHLVMNEQEIACNGPISVRGRPDQVFDHSNGLIPVETKSRSRHRVYESDIEQLSLYGYILKKAQHRPVQDHGYVRTVVVENGRESVEYTRVALIKPQVLERNLSRRRD